MTRLLSPISALLLSAFLLWHHAHAILAPKLSTPHKEIRVKEGQKEVVLECNLSIGDEPISYRWLKQMRLVTAELGHAYRAYRKVNLAFHTVTPAHAGRYECEASNDAGVEAISIDVVVESDGYTQKAETYQEYPDTETMLSELATSLNDLLAEGNCTCDVMFLLHASNDAPEETMKLQANFAYTMSKNLISESIRISVMTYSDYVNAKMNFGTGTNRCALQEAFRDLSHEKWTTRIDPVLQDAFKRFKKSKKKCKIIVLPIFGSLGAEGAAKVLPKLLKKAGIKIFVLEVSNTPIPGADKLASVRGDGHPYHFRVHMKRWPTIVTYMGYMSEELTGCMVKDEEIPGVCMKPESNCTQSSQCEGIGYGCVQGVCKSLDCSARPDMPGCCKSEGDFWCGDVTYDCKSKDTICDGKLQCMNGLDEDKCWKVPCQAGQYRCQSSVLCLPAHALCDGEPHCPGAEDEDPRFCWLFPCPSSRPFRCTDGKCISTDYLCDGVFKNCAGGEDENLEYCSQKHVCPASRPFVCDYGVCKPDRVVCDGTYNCLDALDEVVCSSQTACPAERPFKCGDGKCVELDNVCNGVVDACDDGTDERNCSSFVCPSSRSFKCMDGHCIDRWLECNKRDDCGDNSDELRCKSTTALPTIITSTFAETIRPSPFCPDDEFFCTDGPCLSREDKVCNGVPDCSNGEDEDSEMCSKTACPESRPHKCPDGICVNAILCDGNSDCPDGSDEDACFDNDYEYQEYDAYFGNYTTPTPVHTHTDDDATMIEDSADEDSTVVEEPQPEPSNPKKGSVIDGSGTTLHINTVLLCILLIISLFNWK